MGVFGAQASYRLSTTRNINKHIYRNIYNKIWVCLGRRPPTVFRQHVV